MKVLPFKSIDVQITDGVFKKAQGVGRAYLLSLEPDRLLAPVYEAMGKTPKQARYGGWERDEVGGHSLGHYLSACAYLSATEKDSLLKERIDYVISELQSLQKDNGYLGSLAESVYLDVFLKEFKMDNFGLNGHWVPLYTLHKILAGILDVYLALDDLAALKIVKGMADWFIRNTEGMSHVSFQKMLQSEHGGLNEVFADLYGVTRDEKYLACAKRIYHENILEPLKEKTDDLTGKHGNTQIPKVIGCERIYQLTGEKSYHELAQFFFDRVVKYRSYVIGGNTIDEHFETLGKETLGPHTAETCNTYNMLKLAGKLFMDEPDRFYMDYYEKALYNHILASQNDEGGKCYYVSLRPGDLKAYSTPFDSFWCCVGTGMENPARYQESIYYHNDDSLYVNLFIPSVLNFREKGIVFKQETEFPYSQTTRLTFIQADSPIALKIRKPQWAEKLTIEVNDEPVPLYEQNGYCTVRENFTSGDTVTVHLHMRLTVYKNRDKENSLAFLYGPIVLAGALGKVNYPDETKINHWDLMEVPAFKTMLVSDSANISDLVECVDEKRLLFKTRCAKPDNFLLKPFFAIHHERHNVYWTLLSRAEYAAYEEQAEEKNIVDFVNCGQQQSEKNHNYEGEGTFSGYNNEAESMMRQASGYFQYTLKNVPGKPVSLLVSCSNLKDENIAFVILADGVKVGDKAGTFDLPVSDKEQVTVRFQALEGKKTAQIYNCKILRKEDGE